MSRVRRCRPTLATVKAVLQAIGFAAGRRDAQQEAFDLGVPDAQLAVAGRRGGVHEAFGDLRANAGVHERL